jgi:predicted RNA binding protein YcfA (HicA-like mRNA interferase family)
MKIPRDITGVQLVALLKIYGYEVTRQKGSHIRLTTNSPQEYHITIPHHNPLKIGTLSNILGNIAAQQNIPKEKVIQELFG